ncbi:ferredoxin-type protein NapF [Thalassotalea sp. PS06]|uniref:ferredoxin-type protein NapF n=1 Tax=Thalassotalea sp. PS06 TaxID=2594005 RepID=UPI001164BD2F|nr:ferredoxin-type protein NapF [Thalassotalea sp. PS06]QDP00486.1 ferredoxin-type protein NapF [Thalassotalea sp. PS06]
MATLRHVDLSRRRFLRVQARQAVTHFRLPWSISEQHFVSHCTQCQQCLDVCETNIIELDSDGLPYLNFSKNECTFCGACFDKCPEPLFRDKSEPAFFGQLNIKTSCLAQQQIFCQSCADSCDQQAIRFAYKQAVPTPEIDQQACNQCGACISVCPNQSTELINTENIDLNRRSRL